MKKYTHVVDHAYGVAMTKDGGLIPGHISKHISENAAKEKASKLGKSTKDGNYYAREIKEGDRQYKEHEHPYWKQD